MFTVVVVALLLGALLATALIKLNNQRVSLSTININSAFNQFLLTVTNQVVAMKYLNYYQYTNNATMASRFFSTAASNVNITTAMDNLVVNFDITAITQTWSTLSCNTTTGVYVVGTENNFLTVSDFIQNPVTNLLALTTSSFKFPPYLSAQTLPQSSTSCLYFELILNSLYITIPGFLSLKSSVMDNIMLKSVGVSLPMILIFVAIFLISALYVWGKVLLNIRVTRLKNDTYDLFESLTRELVEEKERNCREFISKYTLINSGDANDEHLLSDHSASFRTDADLNLSGTSRNLTKLVEEETQRELEVSSQMPGEPKTSNFIQNAKKENEVIKAKSKAVFEKSSMFWIGCKYSLLALPFLMFAFIFGGMEIAHAKQLTNAVQVQSQLQVIQQNVHLVSLYALQHGTEDNKYPQLLNLPVFLNGLINQIYSIQRNFVSSSAFDVNALPQFSKFLSQVAYGNLCTLPNMNFPDYLQKNCSTTNNNILTKGLYSSLISYLEELTTLLLANPITSNFTSTQRMAYLANPFFTSQAIIKQYFDAIFTQFLNIFSSDFTNLIQQSTNVLIFANIGIVVGIGLIGALLERHYIKVIRKEILEIKSLFLLISFESIMKDESLKNKFYERI